MAGTSKEPSVKAKTFREEAESIAAKMLETPAAEYSPEDQVPGVDYVCGVPAVELNKWLATLTPAQSKYFSSVFRSSFNKFTRAYDKLHAAHEQLKLKQGNKGNHDEAGDAELRAAFEKIDADPTLSMEAKQQKKMKLAAASIDILLLKRSIEQGLESGDAFARKLYADMFSAATPQKQEQGSVGAATFLVVGDEDGGQ